MRPSPTPLDFIIQTPPAADWQVWVAFVPLIAAIIAALIAAAALLQRRWSDNRSEWWSRTQWALDAASEPSPERRDLGLAVLDVQARSRLAGKEELRIVAEAWMLPLTEQEAMLDSRSDMPDNGDQDEEGSTHESLG